MKMVTAVVRPEVVEKVTASLADAGMTAMTRLDVYGTGLAETASGARVQLRYAQDPRS